MLALVAALIGPYFVDWSGYRSDFEREASRILGRPVTVEGDMTARLLPFPSVSFTEVEVAGDTPDAPAMTIEEFSMDAELAPFMRGEILIFDMRLVRPKALLRIGDDGAIDWAARPSTVVDPAQIRLEKVTVTEGKVTLEHAASGRAHTLTEINAAIAADTLAGPWRMDGTLRLDGMLTQLAVSTGAVTPEGGMRVRMRAHPERYPIDLEADGQAQMKNGALQYAGTFRLDARDTDPAAAQSAEASAGQTDPQAADYRFSGRFALDYARLDVPEFRLDTGPRDNPYTADGTALLDLGASPRFLVQATGAQVRLDEAIGTAVEYSGATLRERFEALRETLQDLPRPAIPGTIDVDLPAVVAGDTTIRDVRLSAEPAEGGWLVNALSATLPGRTTLEASGRLATSEAFGFEGKLLLAVAQPSGFAAWVARDVDDAIRRLPGAGFSAEVALGEERQIFRDVELVLGGTRFEGSLDRVLRTGMRPALTAKLSGGALDVEGMTAFASLFVSDSGVTHFGGHDVDFDLQAGPVSLAGLTAEEVDVAMRLRADQLEIDRLAIEGLAGANVSATASLADIGGDPTGKVDASVLAADLGPLLALVAERFPRNAFATTLAQRAAAIPAATQDAQIDLVASLSRDDGAADVMLTAQGHSGGNDFTVQVSADGYDGDLAAADLSVDVSADAADSAQLLAFYGLPAIDLGMAPEGETTFALNGRIADGAALAFALTSPSAEVRFDGTLGLASAADEGAGTPAFEAAGALAVRASDLEPWLMTTGTALPGMGIGLPAQLDAAATYRVGSLALSDLGGTVAGTSVAGDVVARWSEGVPHLEGALALGAFDAVSAAALVLGEVALEGDGASWSDTPFAEAVQPPFTADLSLRIGALDAGVVGVADEVALQARLDGEGLRLSDLTGRMLGGTAKGLIELKNNGGTGLISAQLTLDGVAPSALLGVPGIEGEADVTAGLTANAKSVEGLLASLAGSGTARLERLVVPGLDPAALRAILSQADAIGRDIDAAAVAAFAPDLVQAGAFTARDLEVPFTIAAGTLRTPPVFLEADGATMTLDVRVDAVSEDVAIDGSLAFDAGEDALVGSTPSVDLAVRGTLGETVASVDTGPLAQFLTQRALEREQARVEAMQAELLEKQRLRREVRYYAALADEARLAAEAEARRQAEEEERRRLEAEEEARRQAEEAERQRREAEAARESAQPAGPAPADASAPPPAEVAEPDTRADPPLPTVIEGGVVRQPLPAPASEPEVVEPPPVVFNADSIDRLLKGLPDRQ